MNTHTKTFTAWSCNMSIEIIEPKTSPEAMFFSIQTLIDTYEKIASRFMSSSLVSALNTYEKVEKNWRLTELLEAAEEYVRFTNGLFNPHVDLVQHGYKQSFTKAGFVTKNAHPLTRVPSFPNIVTTPTHIQLKPNTKIDFGGFVKGFLSQKIADFLAPQCSGLIVNLGGDITTRGSDTQTETFDFFIYNPLTSQSETITLKNQSLSTSGTYKRHWIQNQQKKSHLIDPLKNQSTNAPFLSISFWGTNGGLVDALATAAFFSTPAEWNTWCQKCPDLGYLAIQKNGTILKYSN